MKKTFKMSNLDCAHCALKIEEGLKAISGVEDATVSILSERITITAEKEAFPAIIEQAKKVVNKVEPECEVNF